MIKILYPNKFKPLGSQPKHMRLKFGDLLNKTDFNF